MGTCSRRPAAVVLMLLTLAAAEGLRAQRPFSGTAEVKLALERLHVLGRVLMIGAHPDDENTALLAYWARGRKLRTAYLSLTRGEGGQNLIGPEQGDLMGVIRTQELLAARRIDGAEQFFTRAIDFGFSKSAEETLAKWGREAVLGDVVWVIRRFRPDVIVLRFSGTSRDGHGHHQASAILGKEAFEAAADPARFPEQLQSVAPWRAKRVVWNVFSFNRAMREEAEKMPGRLIEDPGRFDPVLGYSYLEIAGISRSQHRSQGMGAPEPKGAGPEYLMHVAGEPARHDLFEGIDMTWARAPGNQDAAELLERAAREFRPEDPAAVVPLLLEARAELRRSTGEWPQEKLQPLDEAIALASGLWLDARASKHSVSPGEELRVDVEAVVRSPVSVEIGEIRLEGQIDTQAFPHTSSQLQPNQPLSSSIAVRLPPDHVYTQPYWLREPHDGLLYTVKDREMVLLADTPPPMRARFLLRLGEQSLELTRPVVHRWVDTVVGEKQRPLAVIPPAGVTVPGGVFVFPDARPRSVEVTIAGFREAVTGKAALRAPEGWRAEPAAQPIELSRESGQRQARFTLRPPPAASQGRLTAVFEAGGRDIALGVRVLDYPHFPPQTVLREAAARVLRIDVKVLAQRVGYVMGAGDEVPQALRQLGCEVTLLSDSDLARRDLGAFEAIVTGVRAYNTRPALAANQHRLLEFVERGGTLIVQYNVLPFSLLRPGEENPLGRLGPYPLEIGRDRVSVEEVPVTFADPAHPLLRNPNRITQADFEGWVQERGLYFARSWDPKYTPVWSSHDPGEEPHAGGMLYARHGKGVYIFTAYSWFRQLPAGVPGAYRIFANFLSAGKAVQSAAGDGASAGAAAGNGNGQ